MNEIDFLDLANVFADRPWMICLFIFLFTFVLEDVATVSAALIASYGYVMPEGAFMALLAGIILGDIGLYGLGYGASKFQWADNILKRKRVGAVQDWLDNREVMAVLAARFIPGARLPTYTAMGFFGLSFKKFIATVFIASVIWTSVLFTAIYALGDVFIEKYHAYHWHFSIAVLACVILIPRIIQYFIKKDKAI